jgi:hypothetical protein
MWRIAARRLPFLHSIRHESSTQASNSGSGFGKKLFGLTLLTGTAAGGVIGYAYVDPDFRRKIEGIIPQAKPFFDATIKSKE